MYRIVMQQHGADEVTHRCNLRHLRMFVSDLRKSGFSVSNLHMSYPVVIIDTDVSREEFIRKVPDTYGWEYEAQ